MKISGGTSGVRQGVIVGVNESKDFSLNGSGYRFKPCYVISPTGNLGPFALPGDSGSLLVSLSKRPVGLIIGTNNLTWACTIENVMED
ncbi:hypothetical protein [Nannocystis bainbridge]|uniref:Uncharacterized protein n=1 Tax=Nannocystis bainbridge TaxID=2995303 RepID=A0ABT5E979_9BACT|nr:hypothetical protein [Nannocystis bainbridge]MDC0722175.1 hypothetical protein [Nannocystis bainbridge]